MLSGSKNFSLNGAGVDLFEVLPGKHELKAKDQHVYKNQRARNY
jgi:hypothetical protein